MSSTLGDDVNIGYITVVAMEVLQEGSTLMCLMSDGNVRTYTCRTKLNEDELWACRFKKHDELVEMCRFWNSIHAMDLQRRFHEWKVFKYGQDYKQRGY